MPYRAAHTRLIPIVFSLTIAISAFLLFQIQPMIGKFILPWFGGTSAVWTTSMLFFQALLLGGYAYAHFLAQRDSKRQARLHLWLLGAVLLWAAASALLRGTVVTPDAGWKPEGGGFPAGQILLTLTASVGVPYFLLSTTSSLLQAWFRAVRRQSSPYIFYALSNAASLIALISYPLLFEPNLTLYNQALLWSGGFVLYLLLTVLCVMLLRANAGRLEEEGVVPETSRAGFEAPVFTVEEDYLLIDEAVIDNAPSDHPIIEEAVLIEPVVPQRPTLRTSLLWVGLAACASVMLLATTNHITQDLTSTPFLWVVPLSLYLFSFVAAFNDRQVKLRGAYVLLTLAVLWIGYLVLKEGSTMPVVESIVANALLLFVICMLCHTELYARRPHPRYLTSFYLLISIGGALGGLFVSLIAPLIFVDYWEYHLGLAASALVAAGLAFTSTDWLRGWRYPAAVLALAAAGFILSTPFDWINTSLYMSRNFYGVLRVRTHMVEDQTAYRLLHGGIMHGSQVSGEEFRRRPTSYYTESSGLAIALTNHPRYASHQPLRIGVVGLGTGTLAVYGRAGDVIRFYEINPEVIRLASSGTYFTYLNDSPAAVETVLGDARLSMEAELREGGSQNYNLLVVDAFSGDSIPTHLINYEAVALYRAHLSTDGILAFHISNRHINLEPIVERLAREHGIEALIIRGGSSDWQGSYSVWALLGSHAAIRQNPRIAAVGEELASEPSLRMWTDDYSNLIQSLR